METCSICLDSLDGGAVALACGHRFHVACLASMAGAVGTASSTSRRGTLTACPNCRTTSRVAPYKPAAYDVGDRVLALWGHKWFPGDVYAVKDGGGAYEIAWDDEDSSNEIPASRVRAAPLTVDVDAPTPRDARPPAVVTPRAAPPVMSPPAPAPRSSGPPPAPRAVVPQARPPARPAPVRAKTSRFTGVHKTKGSGRWRAAIRVRGSPIWLGEFDNEEDAARAYDAALVKYKNAPTVNFPGEAPLAAVLAALPVPTAPTRRSGRAPAPKAIVDPEAPRLRNRCEVDRCVTCNLAPPLATFSRSLSGTRRKRCDLCRAENEAAAAEKKAAAAREDEAWKAAGVPADLPALREAYAREQAAKKQRV